MEVKTLEGISKKEILAVFNHSFSDYFIPFRLTEAQLSSKMYADKTDLSLSVGTFESGKLIAFILHGFDIVNNQKVVYNGGTGVIPEKRGSGLAKQMYLFILPILIERGIEKVVLEVISRNIKAITSYRKSGFTTKRELLCYKGTLGALKVNDQIEITELRNYNWKLLESFWDILPTWQNSKNVVNELKGTNISYGAHLENELVGYLIYNPKSKRIQQIAVHKNFRNKRVACSLVFALKEKFGNAISIINVDKESKVVNTFFNSLGLDQSLEQLEMELVLDKTINDRG